MHVYLRLIGDVLASAITFRGIASARACERMSTAPLHFENYLKRCLSILAIRSKTSCHVDEMIPSSRQKFALLHTSSVQRSSEKSFNRPKIKVVYAHAASE